jgi:non-ribosomal peptide synthetase component E (peptide arylation enzyme)
VVRHFAALGVAKFKWPERIEQRTELPRTQVGKLTRSGWPPRSPSSSPSP